MKGIQQYRADRRRQQRINAVVNPVVDTAAILTQLNGTLFGSAGTLKARQSTMGITRIFESDKQRHEADTLETVVLASKVAVAAGMAVAKGYTKARSHFASKAYAKAAAKMAGEETVVTETPMPAGASAVREETTPPVKTRTVSFSTSAPAK